MLIEVCEVASHFRTRILVKCSGSLCGLRAIFDSRLSVERLELVDSLRPIQLFRHIVKLVSKGHSIVV